MDKNQAVIDFLLDCPQIQANPLFFNFLNAKDNNKQILTQTNDVNIDRPYIDGSVMRRFTFSIVDFKSVAFLAIPKDPTKSSENVDDMAEVQDILDWITEQADDQNFPDFGENCVVDRMWVSTSTPNLNGVDTSVTPALAKYSMSIQIEYLDNSKKLWK